jgi:hypothetical protein
MKKVVFRFAALALVMLSMNASAQNDFAVWSMNDRIGAASRLNPAFRQINKLQVGLPVLSSYEFGLGNSGFTLSRITEFKGDTLFFDVNKLPDVLKDKNFFYTSQNVGLLSICINRPHYSAELFSNLRTHFVLEYPGDLFKLAIEGNAAHLGETLAFGNIGFNFNNYAEMGVRVARDFDKLTVGASPKLLVGLQNVRTVRNEATLYTGETNYDLEGNLDFLVQTAGFFDSTFSAGIGDEALTEMKGFRNLGWGLDVGAVYRHSDALTFSFSAKDIGRIRWNSMVRSFTTEENYAFNGVDLFDLVEQSDTLNGFDQLIDSLGNSFEVTEFSQPYGTWVPAKLYAGGTYKLREGTIAGAAITAEWAARRFVPAIGLNLRQNIGRKIAASLTYAYYNRDWFNVGFGLFAGAGPIEFYIASDNVLGAMNYLKFRNAHLHFGIQLAFGRGKRDVLRSEKN